MQELHPNSIKNYISTCEVMKMDIKENITITKKEFEKSFLEESYYKKQTLDDKHLNLLLTLAAPQNSDTILDLGTGTGYVAFALAKQNNSLNITGLDIVTKTLERNKELASGMNLNNLNFISYDGISFPVPDECMDIIITRYAMHHFPNIQEIFKEIYRVLKPKGKLVIADPTPNSNDNIRFVDNFMKIKPDGHIKFYTLEQYKELGENYGFKFISNNSSTIRFPRKQPNDYISLISKTDTSIISDYDVKIIDEEIWITEQVLNMVFEK